jgi:uncharacterized membrane protein
MSVLSLANISRITYASSASSTLVCNGLSQISGTSCDHTSSGSSIDKILTLVLNFISAIAGLIAVFAVILGGFRYITSNGNSEKTNQAKDTILYAVIGLVIVAIAQIIVKFVLNKAQIL